MSKYSEWNSYDSDANYEGEDNDFIDPGQAVPRPKRFANDRPTGEICILAQADGRLGYDTDDPPIGLNASARLLHDARNARDLPGQHESNEERPPVNYS
jgi:hypothetical protein